VRSWNKEELYQFIAWVRGKNADRLESFPVDVISLCHEIGVSVEWYNFRTHGLKGMVSVEEDSIILNGRLPLEEVRACCAHELVHLALHREEAPHFYLCGGTDRSPPDRMLEWQANEGAAELLVPMHILLPMLKLHVPQCRDHDDFEQMKIFLAKLFGVTPRAIATRLEALRYEIDQYIKGIPIEEIRILSLSVQKVLEIRIESLNTKFSYISLDYAC